MDDEARRQFGNTLRSLRKHKSSEGKKLTQEVMAQQVGVSPGYIALLEAGHRNPPKGEKLTRLAQAYGTTEEQLLDAARGQDESDNIVHDPLAELEWAFEAIVRDPKYAFVTKSKVLLADKLNLVQIYELSRGRQLLRADEKAALLKLIGSEEPVDQVVHERPLAIFSQHLLKLLNAYRDDNAIPKSKVVGAFLDMMRHSTD